MEELDPGILVANYYAVEELQKSVVDAPRDLNRLRGAIRRVLSADPPAFVAWMHPHDGYVVKSFSREQFIKFIEAPYKQGGLETDVATLRKLLGDSTPERILFEDAIKRGPGNPRADEQPRGEDGTFRNVGNTNKSDEEPPRKRDSNNDVGYAIRRLSRERPDLLGRVRAGELSCNAAMIEAGFRKKKLPLDHLRHWWARAAIEDRVTFIREVAVEVEAMASQG